MFSMVELSCLWDLQSNLEKICMLTIATPANDIEVLIFQNSDVLIHTRIATRGKYKTVRSFFIRNNACK